MSSRGHRSVTSDDQSEINTKTRELSGSSTDSFMTTTTTTKSVSTFYKLAFFNNKLGLIFKIYDGKITLVKVDHITSSHHDEAIEFEEIPGYKTEVMDKLLEVDESSFGKKHGKKDDGGNGADSLVELYSDEGESDEDEKETKSKLQIMEELEKQQSSNGGIAEGTIEEGDEGEADDIEGEEGGISSRTPHLRGRSQRNEQESSSKSNRLIPPLDTTPVVPPKIKKLEYSEIAFTSSSSSSGNDDNYMPISGSAKVKTFWSNVIHSLIVCFLSFSFFRVPVLFC
jgi:hypothetical protein